MKAIVTGATRGIGKSVALKLINEGYEVAICSRNEAELAAVKMEFEALGGKILAFRADLSYKTEVKSFCDFVAAQWDRIDVLVNNAGIFLPAQLLDEPDEDFEIQLSVNLLAPYHLYKFFGKMMREQRSGHIFNICSIASTHPVQNAGSYSVTKSALLCLNNVMRQEMAQHSVKVTAILPGPTLTSSWNESAVRPEEFVKPEDIAQSLFTVLSLSSAANVDQLVIKPI